MKVQLLRNGAMPLPRDAGLVWGQRIFFARPEGGQCRLGVLPALWSDPRYRSSRVRRRWRCGCHCKPPSEVRLGVASAGSGERGRNAISGGDARAAARSNALKRQGSRRC
jgi:hypothetical protein